MKSQITTTTLPAVATATEDPVVTGIRIGAAIVEMVSTPRTGTDYAEIALNMLAAAIYNARMTHNGDTRLRTWNEISRNDVTRSFYLNAARTALRTNFPTEGF